MAKPRYENCEVAEIRGRVEERLPELPASKTDDETPADFWMRVERAGLLLEALALYDEIATARSEWRHTQRETKEEFDRRMEGEGRRAKAESIRAELLASGLTRRQVQAKLVERFQPRDGTKTRAWETPDPWERGRLFKKKTDQQKVLEEAQRDEEEGVTEAENRLEWAELRRDERQALADARRRAWALRMEQERLPRSARRAARSKPSENGRRKSTVSAERKVDRVEI